MKKQSLGKKFLFVGSILTVAFACQPKTPGVDSSQKPSETQSDQDDDDGDDGAYGDGDTSCDHDGVQSFCEVSSTEVEEETVVPVATSLQTETEALVAKLDDVNLEPLVGEVVVLESVSPVEIIAEHQEIVEN